MMNPYQGLPEIAYWRPAVAEKSLFDIGPLWEPKFDILMDQRVVTFGSCFAQHIGRALKNRGFSYWIAEPPPKYLSEANALKYNYNIFSARTANIYTTSLLKQWTEWALEKSIVPDEHWQSENRIYDPFRPLIEPNGFDTFEEMKISRNVTIKAFRECILNAKYFVYTLGLTESWKNSAHRYEYPMCPGTTAGKYDSKAHRFVNQGFNEVVIALRDAMNMMRSVNSNLRFVLTVSPIPLTATNSGSHVLVATMHSKSILRAAAGHLIQRKDVDYFPSYEIISSPSSRGAFFEPNMRSVNPYGVDFVMDHFFKSLVVKYGIKAPPAKAARVSAPVTVQADVVCEEELLGSFGLPGKA
jgi:GSCFA family